MSQLYPVFNARSYKPSARRNHEAGGERDDNPIQLMADTTVEW